MSDRVKSRRNFTLDFCKDLSTSLPSGVNNNSRNFTHCIIWSHRWCHCVIKPTVCLDTVWWRPRCLSMWVAQMTVFSSAILWAVVFLLFSLLSVSHPLYTERASNVIKLLDRSSCNQQSCLCFVSNIIWTLSTVFWKDK